MSYVYYRLVIQKTVTLLEVNVGVGFCSATNEDDCIVFIDVIKDMPIMLPVCHPNGTIDWPECKFTFLVHF